jgi:hypothetical protein
VEAFQILVPVGLIEPRVYLMRVFEVANWHLKRRARRTTLFAVSFTEQGGPCSPAYCTVSAIQVNFKTD